MISATTRRMDRYSASADDKETKDCFFVFHETGDPPRVMTYPLIERRELGHHPQSESQKSNSSKEELEGKNKPILGYASKYRKQRKAASKWGTWGACMYWLKS